MSRHDTPHDGSAVLGTVGGRSYKCTRGNCGADIGHPVNQDAHNAQAHCKGPNCDSVADAARVQDTPDADFRYPSMAK